MDWTRYFETLQDWKKLPAYKAEPRVDRNCLIEFKIDAGSRRKVQDQYLEDAVRVGTAGVMAGIVQLSKASQAKAKYGHLLGELRAAGLLDEDNAWTGVNPTLEILYVQPHEPVESERGIGFGRIADWLEGRGEAGGFERAFAGALRGWGES